jgi:hypothetical protein
MVQLNQAANAQNPKERHMIWSGLLEWHEKQKGEQNEFDVFHYIVSMLN